MKFYEDPTYIEMCRGAGEIQKDYDKLSEYKKANFFLVDEMVSQCGKCGFIGASNFCPDCGGKMKDQDMYRLDHNVNTRPGTFTIWLPRLDQLIDMLDESVSKEYKTPYYKIWEFYEYAMVKTEPHGDWTTEQVMIQFVMYKKYRKEWDFDKKQWVKI